MSISPCLSATSRRGGVGDHAQDQALDRRGLAPVAVEGLQHQLDPRLERDEAVGAGADGRLLEAVLADLLDVLPRHDPRRGGGLRPVVGHEVGPRLAEPEADVSGIGRLDGGDPVLEGLGEDAAIALEGELDVVGGDGLAGMELRALAEDELVDEPVGRHGPRLGQARRHRLARHRLDERVVQPVQDHERRAGERLRRVEIRGDQGRVHAPRHLALGRGAGRGGRGEAETQRDHRDRAYTHRADHQAIRKRTPGCRACHSMSLIEMIRDRGVLVVMVGLRRGVEVG